MSSKNYQSQTYRSQSKREVYRASAPLKISTSTFTSNKINRFSHAKLIEESKTPQNSEEFLCYLYNYVFQEMPDDTNTVFFDSNLRKYRTRSTLRTESDNLLSKSFSKKYDYNKSKNDLKYSVNRNDRKMNLSLNVNIKALSQKEKQNKESKFANQKNNILRNDSEKKAKIFNELRKEKDELLAEINKNSSKKDGKNGTIEKSFNKHNKRENVNIITNLNSSKTQQKGGKIENQAIKSLKGSCNISMTQNQKSNQKYSSKDNTHRTDDTKKNDVSKSQANQKINLTSASKNIKQDNSNIKSSQKKEENTNRPPITNIKSDLPKSKEIQSKGQLDKNKDKNEPIKDNKNHKNILEKKLDNKYAKFVNQGLHESQQKNLNKNENQEENNESNVSILKKHEEKTIVLEPGQTIKPSNKIEKLDNPIEEVIENPDGTRTSLIKQTKVTTTTKSVPHIDKSSEGAPMVKQYITYEYKITTTIKDNDKDGQEDERTNSSKLKNLASPVKNDSKIDKHLEEEENENNNRVDELGDKNQGNENIEGYINDEQNGNKGSNKVDGINGENNKENENVKGNNKYKKKGEKNLGNKNNVINGKTEKKNNENQKDKNIEIIKNNKENKQKGIHENKLKGKNKINEENNLFKEFNSKEEKKKLKSETKLKDKKNVNDGNKKKKEENKASQNHLAQEVLPEKFKTEKELENYLDEINNKGENATPEEKEERMKCIEDIFSNICKEGNNSKENIEKLAELLSKMNEKDRQEILSKLKENFPENEELLNNLLNSVRNKSLKKSGKKGKEGGLQKSGKKKNKKGGENEFLSKIGKKSSKEGSELLFKSIKKSPIKEGNELFSQSEKKSVRGKSSSGLIKSRKNRGSGYKNGFPSYRERNISGFKLKSSGSIEVKEINPLKFDGLFLKITKYTNDHREKNPFEGPSPYTKFYKERKVKIKKKIHYMATEEMEDDDDGREEI